MSNDVALGKYYEQNYKTITVGCPDADTATGTLRDYERELDGKDGWTVIQKMVEADFRDDGTVWIMRITAVRNEEEVL